MSSAQCLECKGHRYLRMTATTGALVWTGLLAADNMSVRGRFLDGIAAMYSIPLLLAWIVSIGYGIVDRRCASKNKQCSNDNVLQNNMHAYSSIFLGAVFISTAMTLVADTWDECISDHPATTRCIPNVGNHQYWAWVPVVAAGILSWIFSTVAYLEPDPQKLWNAAYWVPLLSCLLIVGIVFDIKRAVEATPDDGWRGYDTGYLQSCQLVIASMVLGIMFIADYVAHTYNDVSTAKK